jgi:hypothetical protein
MRSQVKVEHKKAPGLTDQASRCSMHALVAIVSQRSLTEQEDLKFVLLIGVMSFFADFTYEGSRSIIGPYLAVLGASAAAFGIIAGFGELLGYGLRLVSGRLSDQTGQYWPVTIFGYIIQMFAVPLLALAGSWQVAALLIIVERIGKATRIHTSGDCLFPCCRTRSHPVVRRSKPKACAMTTTIVVVTSKALQTFYRFVPII